MEELKNCAFQYAYNPRFGNVQIKEDTGLITLEEAKELWRKWLPDFIKRLRNDQRPEMVIWTEMKDETDYRKSFEHIRSDTETDGKRIWRTTKEYIEI